jgi:hypothetical protein
VPHHDDIHRLAAADIVLGGPEGLPATSFGPGLPGTDEECPSPR